MVKMFHIIFVVLFLIMMKTTGLPLTTTKEEYQQQQTAADVGEKKLRYGFASTSAWPCRYDLITFLLSGVSK